MGKYHGTDQLLEELHRPVGYWTDRTPYGKVVSRAQAMQHIAILPGRTTTYEGKRYVVSEAFLEGKEQGFGRIIAVLKIVV